MRYHDETRQTSLVYLNALCLSMETDSQRLITWTCRAKVNDYHYVVFCFAFFWGVPSSVTLNPRITCFFFWGGGAVLRSAGCDEQTLWVEFLRDFLLLSKGCNNCQGQTLNVQHVYLQHWLVCFFFVWIHIPHIEHRGRVESTPNIMQNSWGTEWWALGIPYKLWNWVVPWRVGNVALWVGEELH